jgi:hypothetical protein
MPRWPKTYAAWNGDGANSSSPFIGLDTLDALKSSGLCRVTSEQCVALAENLRIRGIGLGVVPLIGGLPLDLGWECLELLTYKVMPYRKSTAYTGTG